MNDSVLEARCVPVLDNASCLVRRLLLEENDKIALQASADDSLSLRQGKKNSVGGAAAVDGYRRRQPPASQAAVGLRQTNSAAAG